MSAKPVLVTGASGYIGARLVPRLLDAEHRVRCLVRSPGKIAARPWGDDPRVDVVQGDLDTGEGLAEALEGCGAAFYLVHAMISAGKDYRERDRQMAERFAGAAADAGLESIVYLGGLGETGDGLSEHLASRREVEEALRSVGIPVTIFRAAMIIGSGSASFEILRYLVERLPIMVTPRWVHTECQPIAVRNVIHYLVHCLETPETIGETYDIGGPDVMTYSEIMQEMASALSLPPRHVIPVPFLTPRLSSLWIHLVTPICAAIARPLAEGLKNRVVCRDDRVQKVMPQELVPVPEAMRLAVRSFMQRSVESSWLDAGPMPGDPDWSGGKVFIDRRETEVDANPDDVFRALCRIGGPNGWYAANRLWGLRGILDRMVGGPGLRRWRPNPDKIVYGATVDFWRVTGVEPAKHLELRAEMKLPGIAQLSFDIEPIDDGRAKLVQTARFKPKGLWGIAYWYAVMPLHGPVFRGMLHGIRRRAESNRQEREEAPVTA